jgi:hypothetical protein
MLAAMLRNKRQWWRLVQHLGFHRPIDWLGSKIVNKPSGNL